MADEDILNGVLPGSTESPRQGFFSLEDGRRALYYLRACKRIPRCLVCGNDDIALAVIGFDDDYGQFPLAQPLTSVAQPLEEFGSHAVDYLLKHMAGDGGTIDLRIQPKLVERSST